MKKTNKNKELIELILKGANIKTFLDNDGGILIKDERFYDVVVRNGSLGLGESYMLGWWECNNLDVFFYKILRYFNKNKIFLQKEIKKVFNKKELSYILFDRLFNLQNKNRSIIVGEKHYDIGNELYERMLDKSMTYTCAYWKDANNLIEAQHNKYKLICEKIGLKKGDKVLDIGCGWGGFAFFAAKNYGANVFGCTISKEQEKYILDNKGDLPVEVIFSDYRDIKDRKFDHIISIGMFEHVGYKNFKIYFEKVKELLKDDGLFLLHTIGKNNSDKNTNQWTHKYIFQNGYIPSVKEVADVYTDNFVLEDVHNFGAYYDKTLMAWHDNFTRTFKEIQNIDNKKYDEVFYRMWIYYLLSCAGAFRARDISLYQFVFSKYGQEGLYKSIR